MGAFWGINFIREVVSFLNENNFSFVIFYILIWLCIFYIRRLAAKNFEPKKAIITQYESPQGISPVFARYLITGGGLGGTVREISISGLQTIMLIDLYENGALKRIDFIDEETITYEVDPDFKNMNLLEDQIKFMEYLISKCGERATLNEEKSGKNKETGNGYSQINLFWHNFWYRDLYKMSLARGYMLKNTFKDYAISWFSVSLTFGVFFSILLMFIPIIGYLISLIIFIPLELLFMLSLLINIFLNYFVDTNLLMSNIGVNNDTTPILIWVAFMSWFFMFLLLGGSTKKAMTKMTESGRDLILHIKGYESFLRKTDLDRLSFSTDKDLQGRRKNSSFAWLAIFSIAKDKHWDQFYELHRDLS